MLQIIIIFEGWQLLWLSQCLQVVKHLQRGAQTFGEMAADIAKPTRKTATIIHTVFCPSF